MAVGCMGWKAMGILRGLLVHVPDEACSHYFKEVMALNPSTILRKEDVHMQRPCS